MASARELSREFGGRPTSLLGFGFLGVWPFWAEIIFFISSFGILGCTDPGLPFGHVGHLDAIIVDSNIRR